ncbi:hypothetical protein DID76_02420, partial [Candidatus Marinamargulisbacteria bacterium SCGC AG-414-C22]
AAQEKADAEAAEAKAKERAKADEEKDEDVMSTRSSSATLDDSQVDNVSESPTDAYSDDSSASSSDGDGD